MTFRLTGRLVVRSPSASSVPPVRRVTAAGTPQASVFDISMRRAQCIACPWYDAKCQHIGCPVCPSRQVGDPWSLLRRCPADRWREVLRQAW